MSGPSTIHTGVCEPWATAQEVTACIDFTIGSDADIDGAIEQASDLLYRLSGARYPGLCETTVRPCASHTSCWHRWRWGEWHADRDCSCRQLSVIRLAGYPIREILEVTIDGDLIDAADYRLDRDRELVRLNGERWPSCQRLDLNEGVGTFFVSYVYGLEPPGVAVQATAELARAILKATCPGAGECDLPAGTVRVARQGITIDTQQLGLWLLGTIRTGMPLVDAFLSVYGAPRRRRTALAVPESDPWPLRVSV